MTTFLASFLVFLCAASALALRQLLGRVPGGPCGGCPAREDDACDPHARSDREVG